MQKIQWLFFNKAAWIDVGISPEDFSNLSATLPKQANIAMQYILLTGMQQELNANPKHDKDGDQLPSLTISLLFPQ